MEQTFNEQDSLKLINEMIGKAKKSYVTKGLASIVWGSLIVLCSLLTWAEIRYRLHYKYDVWLLTLIALVPQVWFTIRERKKKKFVSHDETTAYYVWTAFGVSIFFLSFYSARFGIANQAPFLMMFYGIPTFITGGLTGFRPMIFGGIMCWVCAGVSLFITKENGFLIMAAAAIFAWVLPGIILWMRFVKGRRENV